MSTSTDVNDPNLFGPLACVYIFPLTLYSIILINNLFFFSFSCLLPSCAMPWDEAELKMWKVWNGSYAFHFSSIAKFEWVPTFLSLSVLGRLGAMRDCFLFCCFLWFFLGWLVVVWTLKTVLYPGLSTKSWKRSIRSNQVVWRSIWLFVLHAITVILQSVSLC